MQKRFKGRLKVSGGNEVTSSQGQEMEQQPATNRVNGVTHRRSCCRAPGKLEIKETAVVYESDGD